jgi:hypothetical protein
MVGVWSKMYPIAEIAVNHSRKEMVILFQYYHLIMWITIQALVLVIVGLDAGARNCSCFGFQSQESNGTGCIF